VAQPIYVQRAITQENGTGTTTTTSTSTTTTTTVVFDGIISASLLITSLGRYVNSVVSSRNITSAGLVDPNGVILYAKNESLIGTDVFAHDFQALLPNALKQPFNDMLNQSLRGNSGFQDFTYQGVSSTLAYAPVFVATSPNNETNPQEFAVLYISAPDTLGALQASQIALQRNLSEAIILGAGASAVAASIIVLRWNRRLDIAVREKTAELASANERLTSSLAKEIRSRNRAELMQDIMAHDVRNHTQVTVMTAELLREEAQTDPYRKRLFDELLDSIRGTTALVDNALKLGKVMSSDEAKLHPVNLMETIEDSVVLVKSAFLGQKSIVEERKVGLGFSSSSPTTSSPASLRTSTSTR
jgi:signal transduction histidine kinase